MKKLSWLLLLPLVLLVFSCLGCGGGGSSATSTVFKPDQAPEISPEETLSQMLQSWKGGGGPPINLTQNIQAQTDSTATSSPSLGTITIKDLSGDSWVFSIINVIRGSPSTAEVKTQYAYQKIESGEVVITFFLVKIEGVWRLDNIVVEELPWALVTSNGIQGYVRDSATGKPVAGALVYLHGTDYQTSTDATGIYSFKNLPPGTYTIVIVRDGYVLKTITGVVVS